MKAAAMQVIMALNSDYRRQMCGGLGEKIWSRPAVKSDIGKKKGSFESRNILPVTHCNFGREDPWIGK